MKKTLCVLGIVGVTFSFFSLILFFLSGVSDNVEKIFAEGGLLPENLKPADLDGDDTITLSDFTIWLNNFRVYKDSYLDIHYDTFSTEELIAYWTFEETEENVVLDFSGEGNNGSIEGDTAATDGYMGSGVRVQQVGEANTGVLVEDQIDGVFAVNSFSIMAYIYLENGESKTWPISAIFSRGSSNHTGYLFFVDRASNYLGFRTNDSAEKALIYEQSLDLNQWYHVVVTYNSDGELSQTYMYLNGSLVAESTLLDIPNYSILRDVWLGNGNYNLDLHFNGLIDEVMFFSRILEENEISDYYQNTSPDRVRPVLPLEIKKSDLSGDNRVRFSDFNIWLASWREYKAISP